jgi:rifampicin phosphotransferase
MPADLSPFDEITASDIALVGGKGLSLGLLAAAGLPVPEGFCLTTAVHRRLRGSTLGAEPGLVAAMGQACARLGAGPVAVRSSATAEDGATASFAGQQETFLGVSGLPAICEAVQKCWASIDGERALAYRRQQGIRDDMLMAVVVQRLVPAQVAGVLFTRDPLDATGTQMLVEASWGLGESVVSGRVTPDRFHLDRETGDVVDRHLGVKAVMWGAAGEVDVPAELRSVACLDDARLAELAELGRRVEAFHGEPRDIEWAYAEGRFWLLQSRPITAVGAAEREQVRREEIVALTAKATPRGTVWSRFNLAEVLPTPTPMTWSIVSKYLMAGKGGFGLMLRDLGYDPDPALDDEGVFDLVCGRPYCNLSREPRLHYRDIPFEHPFDVLEKDPRLALYPTPRVNLWLHPWHFWLMAPVLLPRLAFKLFTGGLRRKRLARTFARLYQEVIGPEFRAAVEAAAGQDPRPMDDAAVASHLETWTRKTLVDFARDSLKPTALAALAMADLEEKLGAVMRAEQARDFTRELVMGARPETDADLAGGMHALASGGLTREAFLWRFAHRGPSEMELSQPRWGEDPESLARPGTVAHGKMDARSIEDRLRGNPRLNAEQAKLLVPDVGRLHLYLGLRETGKHDLMRGYALIRRALLELDRRHRLDGGIFFLTMQEIPDLLGGVDVAGRIVQRRRRRSAALSLEVPPVLFSNDLDAIGRAAPLDGATLLEGIPLSAGVAEAPALVLESPQGVAAPAEGYILVCPSTDPAWVPLFVQAKGLVMETGGVLSHGAIVAREFGLPAVAGLPGVLRRVRTGQRLRVDGTRGTVAIVDG